MCARGAKPHDIRRFLSVLCFIYPSHIGDENCQVKKVDIFQYYIIHSGIDSQWITKNGCSWHKHVFIRPCLDNVSVIGVGHAH